VLRKDAEISSEHSSWSRNSLTRRKRRTNDDGDDNNDNDACDDYFSWAEQPETRTEFRVLTDVVGSRYEYGNMAALTNSDLSSKIFCV